MTVICCLCEEVIGERNLSKKKVATSFTWRNHGLCPNCFDRARAAIDRAYNAPAASDVNRTVRLVNGPAL